MAEESNVAPPGEPSATAPPMPTIHEAELASGASGAVIRGIEIDMATAVARRHRGENVVVCGDDLKANRRLAERIEAAVGPCIRSAPHKHHAGTRALPHFQQQNPEHEGHAFYETVQQKAIRRKP
jgi:hypothetical protein